MPMALSLTAVLAAIAVGLVGPPLVVYILVGLAVANEALRFFALRSPVPGPPPDEYNIPARAPRSAGGDDGGV